MRFTRWPNVLGRVGLYSIGTDYFVVVNQMSGMIETSEGLGLFLPCLQSELISISLVSMERQHLRIFMDILSWSYQQICISFELSLHF